MSFLFCTQKKQNNISVLWKNVNRLFFHNGCDAKRMLNELMTKPDETFLMISNEND